jgi:hypothetical protein
MRRIPVYTDVSKELNVVVFRDKHQLGVFTSRHRGCFPPDACHSIRSSDIRRRKAEVFTSGGGAGGVAGVASWQQETEKEKKIR